MVRTLASVIAFSSFVLVGAGCSSIRVVKKMPDGGVVALQGAQDGAREKADEYMRSQCNGAYEVLEEGEAVIGSDTTVRQQQTFLGPATTARSTDRSEWRITYKCKGTKNATARTLIVVL
jgi:predicted component of type VI protein secretion system